MSIIYHTAYKILKVINGTQNYMFYFLTIKKKYLMLRLSQNKKEGGINTSFLKSYNLNNDKIKLMSGSCGCFEFITGFFNYHSVI